MAQQDTVENKTELLIPSRGKRPAGLSQRIKEMISSLIGCQQVDWKRRSWKRSRM